MRILASIALFFFALQPLVGGVISQVSCVVQGISGGPLVILASDSGPGYCFSSYDFQSQPSDNPGTAFAEGIGAFGFGLNLGSIDFAASISGSARFAGGFGTPPNPFYGVEGYTTSLAVAQGSFSTPGPVRPGMLRVEAQSDFCTLDVDSATVAFEVAGHSSGFGMGSCYPGLLMQEWQFPLQLGTAFDFLLEFHSLIFSSVEFTHNGEFDASTFVRFSAFDIDDQPVAISEVPEPQPIVLFALCLGLILLARRKGSVHKEDFGG